MNLLIRVKKIGRVRILVPILLAAVLVGFQINCSGDSPTSTNQSTTSCPQMGTNDAAASITTFLTLTDSCPGNTNVVGVSITFAAATTIQQYNAFLGDSSAVTHYSTPNEVEAALYSVSGSTATFVLFSNTTSAPITKPFSPGWYAIPADPFSVPAGNYLIVLHYIAPSANASTLSLGLKTGASSCTTYTTCTTASLHSGFSPWNISTATNLTSCPEVNINACQ